MQIVYPGEVWKLTYKVEYDVSGTPFNIADYNIYIEVSNFHINKLKAADVLGTIVEYAAPKYANGKSTDGYITVSLNILPTYTLSKPHTVSITKITSTPAVNTFWDEVLAKGSFVVKQRSAEYETVV